MNHYVEENFRMVSKMRDIFLVIAMGMFILFFSACASMVKGIPVKEFGPPRAAIDEDERRQKEIAEEIIKMSQVRENSVFTEKRGVPEYKIGPGDVLTITFWDGPKSTPFTTTVRPDGKISYSYFDDIPVAGHTAYEVDEILTDAMKKYIRKPRIDVVVKEFKSKSVLLSGQINQLQTGISGPGKYPLKEKTRILDLIIMAGGPILTASQGSVVGQVIGSADLRHVEFVRKGAKYTLNLYRAMFKGDMSQNIVLDDGDIITLPELPTFGERIYVFGEVNDQGLYRLKDSPDLLAAISQAGGTTTVAVDSDIKIIRGYGEKPEKPIILSANLDQILKKGDLAQNISLKDGDVVYVPRTAIGDINQFIANTVPLLDYLFYPGRYRDKYWQTQRLRIK